MRILLTGGTGFIGRSLVRSLVAGGHEPVVLSRHRAKPADWPNEAKLMMWAGAPAPLPEGCFDSVEAVINLAGESIGGGRWTEGRKNILWNSRIGTTKLLREAIDKLEVKPAIVISASAIGYYGFHGDEELTEADQPGTDFLATLCSHWEDEAKPLVRHGIRLVLIRTGLVLETGGSVLPRMMLPFKLFVGGPVGSGRQVMSWIHRDDVIGMIHHILTHDSLSGPINLTAPHPVTNREFSTILGRVMSRPSFIPTPSVPLKLALGEMAEIVLNGQRVMPKRALEFGYRFRFETLEGALRSILGK